MQQRLEVTHRRQRLIENCQTTDMKSQTCATKGFTIDLCLDSCDPHTLGGDQCGEQRGPDLERSTTQTTPSEPREASEVEVLSTGTGALVELKAPFFAFLVHKVNLTVS